MTDDMFADLRPPEPVQVPVGSKKVLEIRPPTLKQYVDLSKILRGIENLPDLVVPVLKALEGDGDRPMLQVIREQLPAVWKGAKDVLLLQFPQALQDVARLSLLTEENAQLLDLSDHDVRDPKTKVFMGNPRLENIITQETTPAQAANVLIKMFQVLQVGALLGKALETLTLPQKTEDVEAAS